MNIKESHYIHQMINTIIINGFFQLLMLSAWDLWNINNGETPGNKNIILASVDLGVTFSHPDLRNNIWQNLGEDADGDGRLSKGQAQIGI